MALDVYKAVEVVDILQGGSTQPLVMRIVDSKQNYQKNYVVKIFKVGNIEQYQPTNKEFYVNALAKEFDLAVPKAAIIEVDNSLITELKNKKEFEGFELEEGYYYGCEFLDNSFDYNVGDWGSFEKWNLETIFAFDVLIWNVDRRVTKPNILIHEQEFYLIDHELTFDIPQNRDCSYYLDPSNLEFLTDKGERTHIFYSYLKEINKKELLNFDLFGEYLNTLSLLGLDEIANQLKEYIPQNKTEQIEYGEVDEIVENKDVIVEYLRCIKQHRN